MDIEYGIKISLLSEEDGGGYFVEVPDLPGCMTDGDTLEEALCHAQEAIETWLEAAKKIGRDIPETKYYSSEERYSGKLTLRMPKALHKELVERAAEENVSVNQLMIYLLSKGIGNSQKKDSHTEPIIPSRQVKVTYEQTDWEPTLPASNAFLRTNSSIRGLRQEGK